MNQIRVSTGNPFSAMFFAIGRDFIDLARNPLALVGGLGGLALTSLAMFLGSEALAEGSNNDCERLTLVLEGTRTAQDEASGRLSAVDTDIGLLKGRLEGIDTNLTNAPTPELQTQKVDLEAQIKALEAKRPALDAALVSAAAAAADARTALGDASCETPDDEFEIDFTPGTLARLGEKLEEKEIPQKIIIQETRAEDFSEVEPVKDSVTTDEKVKPSETPPEDKPKEVTKDKPKFQDNKDKKLPTAKVPTKSNTPYKDLPTADKNEGDPFGDPEGWDDLTRDGDPWATEVMKKLNNMPVGAYAGKGASGDYKFQLTICKDGTIKDDGVLSKGGSLSQDGKDAVRLALESLQIPKPPKKVADSMPSKCAKLKYTFVWSSKGVK